MAAYAALVILEHIIDDLQRRPDPSSSRFKKQITSLTAKVYFLQKFLEVYNPSLGYSTEADPLEIRIADAAYAAVHAIETRILDRITSGGENISSNTLRGAVNKTLKKATRYVDSRNALKRTLKKAIQDVDKKISSDALHRALKKVINDMASIEKKVNDMAIQVRKSTPPPNSSSSSSSMVGADGALSKMKDKLTSHRYELQIIPIVGMGGTGKTTITLNIYQDRHITYHFDVRAWVTISQEYSIQQILIQILKQLIEEFNLQGLNEGELGEMLYKHLYGRRYLIVMDDIWSIDACDAVRNILPDNKNGSRVVVTTRLSNLAFDLAGSERLEMNLLDEDKSWELLSKTVFGEECHCPHELEDIGKKIGKSCKGLPLSIVAVGGVLAKSEQTREFWEHIEGNLNSIVNLEDDERCLKILYMSYKQLPVYLKPCFLYMGFYHEDQVIRISNLIRLWIDEGLLKAASGKCLEEVGRECLESLVDRNLVLIVEKGKTGNIKYCRIHDLLRDMCLREAKKERFYYADPTRREIVEELTPVIIRQGMRDSCGVFRRSALITHQNEEDLVQQYIAIVNSMSNKKVEVLPWGNPRFLICIPIGPILQPIRSNYRNLSRIIESSDRLVNILSNLKTLCVGGSSSTSTGRADIWRMRHIRHLEIERNVHVPLLPNNQDDDIVCQNLQTLKKIWNVSCSESEVEMIGSIRKLRIIFTDHGRVDEDGYCLTNLDRLDKIESFYLSYRQSDRSGPDFQPTLINFPRSLKKLTLYITLCQCSVEILEKIGLLPCLEKLLLFRVAFKESEWVTTQGRFPSLKYLFLDRCKGLKVWTTESSHFPCLEHLHLKGIDEMEIPIAFAEIDTLRIIELNYCEASVVSSAQRILEEQEKLCGETSIQVQVVG